MGEKRVFPQPEWQLGYEDSKALTDWANIQQHAENLMEYAGAARNVTRHAESWGPKLIAMMVGAGVLEPEGNPEEALQLLIDHYHHPAWGND